MEELNSPSPMERRPPATELCLKLAYLILIKRASNIPIYKYREYLATKKRKVLVVD